MPHIPSLGYSHCEAVRFRPFVFYPDKPIQVQITVNHIDTSDMTYVHDAAVSWIEDVSYEQFTGCVMAAGYNERKSRANVSIDWIAYQGAPVGGVTGEVRMSQWWTGTTCKTVSFPSVSQWIFSKRIPTTKLLLTTTTNTTTTTTTNSITITTPTGLSSKVYHENIKRIRGFFMINFLDSSLKNYLKDLFGSYILFYHFRL